MASLRYDSVAKAFYVRVRSGKVAETEPLIDSVFLDLDAGGKLLGTEAILPKDITQEMVKQINTATAKS